MDRLRVGRSLRAIRTRLAWRHVDVAAAAGVSRAFVSKVERGLIRNTDLEWLERARQVLGADLDVHVRCRGEGLDRLLDEAHAVLTTAWSPSSIGLEIGQRAADDTGWRIRRQSVA